ncbi:hypothetical protein ACVWZA_004009 [Sphingomonas sp. UYAg733]
MKALVDLLPAQATAPAKQRRTLLAAAQAVRNYRIDRVEAITAFQRVIVNSVDQIRIGANTV